MAASVGDDDAIHLSSEAGYQFTDFLGIERSRQGCKPAQVGKQDRDLAALAGRMLRCPRGVRRRCRSQFADCGQQPLAMAERGQAKFFDIRLGEPAENVGIDIVLGKRLGVLGQSQIPQPLLDSHAKVAPLGKRQDTPYPNGIKGWQWPCPLLISLTAWEVSACPFLPRA